VKLGWITLPSFYADMDRHQKSTTKDVLALLKRLKKENISGLIVDLRRNGGGSLEEAIALTGLFLKSGPIVQTKGSNGNIVVSSDPDPGIAYTGPMIVLTSRQSASPSGSGTRIPAIPRYFRPVPARIGLHIGLQAGCSSARP